MEKIDLSWKEIFKDVDVLKKEYVKEHSSEELDFTDLDRLADGLSKEIEARALSVDENMRRYAEMEVTRLGKQVDGVKAKLIKTSKSNHEQAMKSIESIKERLFPGGGLQERSTNFLSFCSDGEIQSRLDTLYQALNPFSENLIVLIESD